MVATRSQDQEHAPSATGSKESSQKNKPLRLSGNKKKPHESRFVSVPASSTRKRKLEDISGQSEETAPRTVAAVVIPTSLPEIQGSTNKEPNEDNGDVAVSGESGDHPSEEVLTPPLSRDRITHGGLEIGSHRLGEHVRPWTPANNENSANNQQPAPTSHLRPWTPASDEKPAGNKQLTPSSPPKPTLSSQKKAKKSHKRDPRMDLSSLVDIRHQTPPMEHDNKSCNPKSNSKHKHLDDEVADTLPLSPHPDHPPSEAHPPSETHPPAGYLDAPNTPEQVEAASSEDEAPEVVTQSAGLEHARAAAAEAIKAAGAQQAAKRQKRRDRDKFLKSQSKPSKKQPKVVDPLNAQPEMSPDDDVPNQVSPPPLDVQDQMEWSKHVPLPELLPEEVLAAEPAARLPTPPPQTDLVKISANKKRRFLEQISKPPKDVKKGNVRIRVLEDGPPILPPKISKTSQMIRESWLAGRTGRKGKPMMERRKVGGGFVRR